MELFFKDLTEKIIDAVKNDIQKILKEIKEETIYAAALVTDSDCVTLFLAVNTYESMRKKDLEYIELLHNNLSEQKIADLKEGKTSLTKWIPDEWGYSDGKNSKLNQISELLYEAQETLSEDKEYEKFTSLFLESVTTALKALIDSNAFKQDSQEITYFISMSDDERTYKIENNSAKFLNKEKIYQEFLNRLSET